MSPDKIMTMSPVLLVLNDPVDSKLVQYHLSSVESLVCGNYNLPILSHGIRISDVRVNITKITMTLVSSMVTSLVYSAQSERVLYSVLHS